MKTKLAAVAVLAVAALSASTSFAQSVVATNPHIRAEHAQLVAGRQHAREAHEVAMAAMARIQRDKEELHAAWHAGDMRAVSGIKLRLAADRNTFENAKAAEHADRATDRAKWLQLREDISSSHH
jgi:hypothetical protein